MPNVSNLLTQCLVSVPIVGSGVGASPVCGAVTGTGSVVLGNSPSITTPSLLFATGASNNITAASSNTGFENLFQVINSGTVSNSGT
jgi:hypothetical protein